MNICEVKEANIRNQIWQEGDIDPSETLDNGYGILELIISSEGGMRHTSLLKCRIHPQCKRRK